MLVTPEYGAAGRGNGRPQLTEREREVLNSLDDAAIVRLVDAALSDMV
jgi:hypothetical protein